jgi:LysR family transcriptional regulator for bpeEF and oprC
VADLNDLRVFERVCALRSFSAAARALSQPKSNVSRSISRLETELGTRLVQRTTREFSVTTSGLILLERCSGSLVVLSEALDYVRTLGSEPHGQLRVSVSIGFGINVLADQLPEFAKRHSNISIMLDLTSRNVELVSEGVDVAIRFGPLSDSSMVAVRLGEMNQILCGSPSYLMRMSEPQSPEDLCEHEVIEMPSTEGRARIWRFLKDGVAAEATAEPRISVNDALMIHRLVLKGAGIGIVPCYLCAPDIAQGRLVHLLPEWSAPVLPVNMLFPSKRELSPAVRAFVNFMKEANPPGVHWQTNELPLPR